MMKDVVKIQMGLEVEGNEIEVSFGMAIQKYIDEDLTKKEREEIERLSVEISKIVSKAVKRGINEEEERDPKIDDLFEKTKDELYDSFGIKTTAKANEIEELAKQYINIDKLSEEDKKKVDEFRKKLDDCKTLEDALLLAMEELENELK